MQRQRERIEARAALGRLLEQNRDAVYLLGVPDAPTTMIDEGLACCRRAVDAFGARTDPGWLDSSLASSLSHDDRASLRLRIGELLDLWARALIWKAEAKADERQALVAEAQRLSALADETLGPGITSRRRKLQSASLARLAGREAAADDLRAEAEATPRGDLNDQLLLASWYLEQGLNREALTLASECCRQSSLDANAWLIRGHCLARSMLDEQADQSFSLAIELRPDLIWGYFHRGLVALHRREFDQALADFDRVLEIRPDEPEVLLLHAEAKLGQRDVTNAIAELDHLLKQPNAPTRALFLRSRCHAARGDRFAADADFREAMTRTPRDAVSWIERGQNRLPEDTAGALNDFRAALKLNAKSLDALLSEARVLSDTLGRSDDALSSLDRAVKFYPQSHAALLGRAVLLARVGQRDDALKDVAAARLLGDTAETLYRAACAFALVSKMQPADAGEAMRLLTLAAQKDGSRLAAMHANPDLASLRNQADFRKLCAALRVLWPTDAKAR